MLPQLVVSGCIPPDRKRPHNFLLDIVPFQTPNPGQGLSFGCILVCAVQICLAPPVEEIARQNIHSAHVDSFKLLFSALHWFECLLVPLFESDTHFEMADALKDLNEPFKRLMALLVKMAVIEKLVHDVLLAAHYKALEKHERVLGYK